MKSFSMSDFVNRIRKLVHSPLSMMLLLVLVIMSVSSLYLYITVYLNEKNIGVFDTFKSQEADREWDIVEGIILQNNTLARTSTRVSALELEQQLKNSYPDLGELKKEFDNGNLSNTFHTVLSKQFDSERKLNETKPYLTVIGTRDYMIGSFGKTSDSIISGIKSESRLVPWQEIYQETDSPQITEESFKQVMKLSDKVTFIQTSRMKDGDFVREGTMDELHRIYEEHGISGLKNITLLSPAYITETGDIFGTRDHYYMQKNQNHKIIIIQFINLGELLADNKDIIIDASDRYEYMEQFMITDNTTRVLFAIIWVCIMFIVSMGLVMIYNIEGRKRRSLKGCNPDTRSKN